MRVEMRYATPADYRALHGEATQPFTRYGYALAIDDVPVALGCLRYDRSRHLVASVDMTDEARKHPFTLHRWAKCGLRAAERLGVRSFLVTADRTIPRSDAWISRLGLRAIGETEIGTVYLWQASTRNE